MNISIQLTKSTAEFTRPADATAYAIGDIMSNSTTQADVLPLTFTKVHSQKGGTGVIRALQIVTEMPTVLGAMRLHLYNAPPAGIADNAPNTLLYADISKRIGIIDIAALTTGGTGSTGSIAYVEAYRQFTCVDGSTTIYGVLEARAAITPVASKKISITLFTESH